MDMLCYGVCLRMQIGLRKLEFRNSWNFGHCTWKVICVTVLLVADSMVGWDSGPFGEILDCSGTVLQEETAPGR